MKKFLNISILLLVALTMGFTSCRTEDKDLFEDSAAQRLAKSKEYFSDILLDKGGKWQLEYFTTTSEPGYIYLFTFASDGSVTISGENKYIGQVLSPSNTDPVYGSAVSMWEVITDNGPVLSLNTYNKFFHLFADPHDIYDTDYNEQGYGHEGDYEFDLMKYSNDTLYIEGKKHGVSMIMTRVAADVDDHQYLDEVVALKDSLFHAKIPTNFINLPSGYRYVVNGSASLMLDLYPETGDPISETESYNALVTHDGLTFMYPLILEDRNTGEVYEFQKFSLAPDGSLVCRENPEITITADALNGMITDTKLQWKLNTTKSSESGFMEAYNALKDQLLAANKNNGITQVLLYFDKNLGPIVNPEAQPQDQVHAGQLVLSVTVKVRVKTTTRTIPCLFYFDVEKEGHDVIGFKFNGETDNAAAQYSQNFDKLPGLANSLASSKYKLSAASLLAPIQIKMEEASNSSNYIVLDVIRK